MPPTIPALRIVTLPGPALSAAAVAELARQISSLESTPRSAIVIDCHNVVLVLPDGLTALLELRARHAATPWVLVALSKAMLAAALETALADLFWVCSDAAAATRALAEVNS